MNIMKERILKETESSINNYPWSQQKELMNFCVCSEFLEQDEEEADFDELVCIVDKDWLYDYIENYIENLTPLQFLQEEYTSYDSIEWYQEAITTGHLAMINFK